MAQRPVRAFIALGANLGDPYAQVLAAFEAIAVLPATRLLGRSPLYRSDPVGPPGQPDYVNAVAMVETRLSADALLEALQAVEAAHGRTRQLRWGPRTLDLDLLVYGDEVRDDPRLTLPHPRLPERAFVLYPLADLDPDLHVAGFGFLSDLISKCPYTGLERMG